MHPGIKRKEKGRESERKESGGRERKRRKEWLEKIGETNKRKKTKEKTRHRR